MEDTKEPAPPADSESEPSAPGGELPEAPPTAFGAAPAPSAGEETTEAFAELLAESQSEPEVRWRKGEKVKARVVRVTREWVFVSLGGKEEGSIRATEFQPAEAGEGDPEVAETEAPLPREGDEIEAFVLSASGGEIALTTKLGRRDISLGSIEEAWRSGIPVEGRIAQAVKGGYEVRIAGLRAFCPLSQIDLRWPKNPAEYVGQSHGFKVLEFKERGRNIIVSRRLLLEEERAKLREDLKETLVPGAIVKGCVRSVQNFGAFVDLGGVDALIPVSEMSWGRVENPADVLTVGQEVTAKVLTTDWERDRVSLSLKSLTEDPWEHVAHTYQSGQRVIGTVARLAPFGAFITVEPGVDGLVHISALGAGRRVKHPKEVLHTGEEVEVEVVSVDPDSRRISLSLEHRYLDSLGALPDPNDLLAGTVEKVAEFGIFVKLPSGHTGLVPNVEMGTPKGTDHRQMFQPGDPMEVVVLGVEEGGKRIRLSRKSVARNRDQTALQEYSVTQGQSTGSLGTLGDLLKDKLKQE